jgi:signal transduction histidine kinase
MACSIAHELKSPVAHSGVLVRGYPVKSLEDINVFREKLDKVQRQSSDVISRTTQIFTQGTSSDIVNEDVNVKDLFDQVMMGNLYSRQYRERIKVNIEPDVVVYAYPNNLFTILENLLKNAYKLCFGKEEGCAVKYLYRR